MIQRRTLLAALAAAPVATRLGAVTTRWSDIADRAGRFAQLRSMIVAVDGADVFAKTFSGPDLDTPVNVKSVSKTIVSALTGIAVERGEIAGLDATLGDTAPRLIPANAVPGVSDITVANLLSMQAGLERTSGPNYGAWIASPDWVAYALSRDVIADPGGRMLYSTGTTHVLGAVLADVTGLSLLEQARQRLGQPLDIVIPPWTRDPQGRFMGGNQMAMSPRAMIKFGEMYRKGGQDIISPDWIEASWQTRTRSPWSGLGYGLGWFLGRDRGNDFALARGYGGQIIAVAPDLALTVAITSDPDQPARSQGYFGDLMALLRDTMAVVRQG